MFENKYFVKWELASFFAVGQTIEWQKIIISFMAGDFEIEPQKILVSSTR